MRNAKQNWARQSDSRFERHNLGSDGSNFVFEDKYNGATVLMEDPGGDGGYSCVIDLSAMKHGDVITVVLIWLTELETGFYTGDLSWGMEYEGGAAVNGVVTIKCYDGALYV